MSRAGFACFGVAALGLLVLGALAFGGVAVVSSYLAAWLLVLALPLGALPLVMGLDALGLGPPIATTLRAFLRLMPLAAVMAVPVLANLHALYGSMPPDAVTGFARAWLAPEMVVGRAVVFLAVWVGLALWFLRQPAPGPSRAGVAILGLGLHLVMGTIAAADWVGAVELGLKSSSLGLLVILAQCGIAFACACLAAARSGEPLPASGGAMMAILFGAWLFLQFTQYLVVWSANLPEEVLWYVHREAGLGAVLEVAALVVFGLVLAAGLTRPGTRVLGVGAALVFAVHAAEMFWLIAPASRDGFWPTWSDLVALVVACGLIGGAALLWGAPLPQPRRFADGAA